MPNSEALRGRFTQRAAQHSRQFIPCYGNSHLISLRVQGARRGYYAGLKKGGLAIYRKTAGRWIELAEKACDWTFDREIKLGFRAEGTRLTLSVNGRDELSITDDTLQYGMVGLASCEGGRSSFGNLRVKELENA